MTCILLEPTTILTHLVVDEGQKIPESHTESSLHIKYTVGDIHLYATYIYIYLHITLYSGVSCDSCVGWVHSGLKNFLEYTHCWDQIPIIPLNAGAVEGWIIWNSGSARCR